jgi:hypothetical protein
MKRQSILSALLFTVVLMGGFVAGRVHAAQPHMNAALNHLRGAHHELDMATADKGGHRAKAMGLVRDAIVEVEAGIEFGRR